MWTTIALLLVTAAWVHGLDETTIHSEQFIRQINEAQDLWTAGRNFHPGSSVKNLLSVLPLREERLPSRKIEVRKNLPKSFDSRKNWKKCKAGRVKEQGNCASAWALVAAGVFTDRLCISKLNTVEISAQNVLSCCKTCGTNCFGGYVSEALTFLGKNGAPSKRCHPYEIYGCPKTNVLNCPAVRALNPRCRTNCRKPYPKRPNQDLHHTGGAYSLVNSSEVIMSEIVERGPVAAVMDVYEDFFVYKSGVYAHTAGRLVGQHPVKVVGWGLLQEQPYWLVPNTWSGLWGDKGMVKIAMGTNGCNLENRVFTVTLRS